MPLKDAVSILKTDSGSHFDPDVVNAFLKCLPNILLHHRGKHFPPQYVDEILHSMAPELVEKKLMG
ncbi:hypothetical protein KKA14_01545 [bacterium]|nr:hypothetical protein [bacterium]